MIRTLMMAVALLALGGCSMEFDRKIEDARQSYHAGVDLFLRQSCAVQEQGMRELIAENQALRSESIRLRDEAFWQRHTNKAGRLVSLDEHGVEQPMKREDVEAFVASRDADLAKAGLVAQRVDTWIRRWTDQVSMLSAANATLADKDKTWLEDKESAAAAVNSVISAIGGVAAGAGIGIAAAP